MNKGLLFASVCFLGACVVGDEIEDDDEIGALAGPNARFTIVQHNVEKKQGPIDQAIDAGKDADAITLQEVCPAQLTALEALANRKSWTLASQPVPHASCDNKTTFPSVVAIWTGGPGGGKDKVPQLGDTANTPGQMACVSFPFKGVKTHVCSVKLISTYPEDGAAEAIRRTQTRDLRAYARNNWFGNRGDFGVIAGDFNANVDQKSIDALYVPAIKNGDGDFTEYNRSGATRDGRPTAHGNGEDIGPYDKKVDYVFFSRNRAPLDGPAVTIKATGSDHDMVTSSVMMAKK